MVKVAGIWERTWNAPITEYNIWRTPMQEFDVEEWYMAPISGISRASITEIPHIRDCINLNPDFTPIFLDENGDEDLTDFQHPENALYILGKTGGAPKTDSDLSVKVETPTKMGKLWAHQVICIVLYDRMKKWQQS